MTVRELSRDECLQVLAGARLARLACAKEDRPYIVPVYIAFARPDEGPCLYGFTTPGQKVEWMRANPLVCVEVDEVTAPDHWVSVVVDGRYEELPDTGADEGEWPRPPESSPAVRDDGGRDAKSRSGERLFAHSVLQAHAEWWQPGSTAHIDPVATGRPTFLYYRVSIDRISGHRAIPDV